MQQPPSGPRPSYRQFAFVCAIAAAGCLAGLLQAAPGPGESTSAPPDPQAVERGRKLFFDTQELMYPSCAQCHNLIPEAEEAEKAKYLAPGGTLYGSAVRAGWRDLSTYADVGEASQICAKRWQQRKRGLSAAQRADLVAFLKTYAPPKPLPKRKVGKRPGLLKQLQGGNAKKGKALFMKHCAGCHNKSDDAISVPLKPGRKRKEEIARKVRGYDSERRFRPGSMSYFTGSRLPDEELRNIVAYLGR